MRCGNLLATFSWTLCLVISCSALWDFQGPHKLASDAAVFPFMPRKIPHHKERYGKAAAGPWEPYDLSPFDSYQSNYGDIHGGLAAPPEDHNRVKRRAKIRPFGTEEHEPRGRPHHYEYPKPVKDRPVEYKPTTARPSVLPDRMSPGVVFRVRMSDAILRIKQRMYDDPERHIASDIIYTNLIKKVVVDEITKFHNLLMMYRTDKTIKEHVGECGGRIYKFISFVTVKVHIYCLFDSLWIDGTPYVIGDEYSVTPLEVPPQLQCDAAECNALVFVDSLTDPKDLEE